jgi:predicted nuclease of predicted toxin-antitoxin system
MRFLVDAQLPPALAHWLEAKGHTAAHVADVHLLDADDAAIWEYARSAGSAIVTKDADFSVRTVTSPAGPAIVWIRIGNATNRALLDQLESLWPEVEEALQRGERLIEVA